MSILLLSFMAAFSLMAWSCYKGDDDVVYKCLDRKPTASEALARIRFVMLKTITSIFGGALSAIWSAQTILHDHYSTDLSKDQAVLLIVTFIFLFSLLIGVFQNVIRQGQGRSQHPLIDAIIWKHNLRQWISNSWRK